MSWQERLREAAYRSPNSTRTVFTFQDVSRVAEKKTSAFDFPDADGTLVQDLGRKGRRYPLRVIFAGDNHDLEADAFEQTLLERGAGVLEHPRYGQVDVVPFGEITQRDDLKTRANQTVLEVVFWATIGTAYPTGQNNGTAEALAAVDEYTAVASGQLEEALQFNTQFEVVTFRDQWDGFLNNVQSELAELAEVQGDIARQFNNINDSINRSIDVLIAEPLTLSFQTLALIKVPARAAVQIEARLSAYGNLALSIMNGISNRIGTGPSGTPQTVQPTNDSRAANELASRELFAQGAIAGSVTATMTAVQSSVEDGGYSTQPQAIMAAELLLEQFEQVTDWVDQNYCDLDGTGIEALSVVDTGAGYQQLYKSVSLAAGVLVQLAFNLRQERRITLDRARSLYDFVGEYYGDIDANLDFFINSNDLTGSEILELPKGRTVVVYG
jgi:prophage DNA circulation protein